MTTPRLTVEQQALCSDPAHLEMARRLAARYARKCPWLADEFESAALFGLVDAATRFDPARGLKFATFAGPRIIGTMTDMLRNTLPSGYRRNKREAPVVVSLSEPLGIESQKFGRQDGAKQRTLVDTVPSGELPVGWELESADEVRGVAAYLSVQNGIVLRLLFTHAAYPTMARTGKVLRMSESNISRIVKQAIHFTRRRLESKRSKTC